jgi:hypothetical protein
MSDVRLKSGELPRYFAFSGVLSTVVTTGVASSPIMKESPYSAYQAIVTGTGAVTATVLIQVSNEEATFNGTKANWITAGTITLTGTTTATDGFVTEATWRYVRANVTAASGTGATVEVIAGI